ncbi:unnamed protein product [Boreogadus saida]
MAEKWFLISISDLSAFAQGSKPQVFVAEPGLDCSVLGRCQRELLAARGCAPECVLAGDADKVSVPGRSKCDLRQAVVLLCCQHSRGRPHTPWHPENQARREMGREIAGSDYSGPPLFPDRCVVGRDSSGFHLIDAVNKQRPSCFGECDWVCRGPSGPLQVGAPLGPLQVGAPPGPPQVGAPLVLFRYFR